jgi:hypothetical protein
VEIKIVDFAMVWVAIGYISLILCNKHTFFQLKILGLLQFSNQLSLASFASCCYQSFASSTAISFGCQLLFVSIDGLPDFPRLK